MKCAEVHPNLAAFVAGGVCAGLQFAISKLLSLLRLAPCCTVLRSRWCQHQPPIHLLLTRPG